MRALTKNVSNKAPRSRPAKTSDDVSPSTRSTPRQELHQTLGNQGVQRLLRAGVIQAKLEVSQPGDSLEREADSVAEQVLRMPQPELRDDPEAGKSIGSRLSRHASGASAQSSAEVPPSVHDVLRSPGQPLDTAARAFMEPRFGYDFSQVRVHADAKGAQSARAVDAHAYTVGRDVVFGAGQYAPGTTPGRKLLAHELTHVVQQAARPHGSNRVFLQRMRRVREFRELAAGEIAIAKQVFKETIPYDQIMISDGLGGGDRPFTLPTSVPATALFNVGEGKYVIHAGDGYYGMSFLEEDKQTLIHELAHVWQGEHSSHSWDYVLGSVWSQALSDDAYKYDKNRLGPWDDYNPEQQAKIVEDWFADGMKEGEEEDRRFYYIKKYIWGEQPDHDWIAAQWAVKPVGTATLHVDVQGPPPDDDLLPILKPRFHKDDVAGYGGRVKKLEAYFQKLRHVDAFWLLQRLEARRPGDKVAQYFHDHLSTATRDRLTEILRNK